MKYVDEFRDPVAARGVLAAIARTVDAIGAIKEKPVYIMEICGGHTHAIFRYGLDKLTPPGLEFIHGPGCPVCVLPMPRVDEAVEIAERNGVIFTTFGDAMRVPGTKKSLLQAKADGADIRMVYSPLDALDLARRNPNRDIVFFGLGFETTTPSTALSIQQAAAEGLTNFSVFCNHITVPPPIKALLDDPFMILDGFVGPGHVSMVIGTHPYDFIARDYGKPIVVAGFEPLDLLQSVLMVLTQISEGRAEVENQYARIVPEHGNPISIAACNDVYEPRDSFNGADRRDRQIGTEDQGKIRRLRCGTKIRHRLRHRLARAGGARRVSLRRCDDWPHQAARLSEIWPRLHAGGAAGRLDGFVRRRLRSLLPVWRRASGGCRMNAHLRPPRRLSATHVTLAHGGGGKAMRDLVEDVFVAAFANPAMGEMEDQARLTNAALTVPGARLAFTTDAFVVDPIEFPGGDIGKIAVCGTVNDLVVGGAAPLWLSAAFIIEEGVDVALLRRIAASMRAAADEAGVAIVTGDTKVVGRGSADKIFIATSGIGVIAPDRDLRASAVQPGDVAIVNGTLGDHGAAIMVARGDMNLSTEIVSDCRPLGALMEATLAAAPGIARGARRDARRSCVGAE